MKKEFRKVLIAMMAVCMLLPMTSCDDMDDWFDDDLWEYVSEEHDMKIEDTMIGHWWVAYVEGAMVECPYYDNQEFYFRPSGVFEAYDGNRLFEKGRWYVKDGRIIISFGRGRADMVCRIQRMNRRYVSLKITDYSLDTRYYIDLEK